MKCQISSGLLNIVHTINGRNLIIVFDTSGSMYQLLDFVKTSIYKLTHYLSHVCKASSFNVISSATTNNLFSDSLVLCTKENLSFLSSWLSSLQCETQTNMLLAILAAFSNERCDGVVVFSDGSINQKSSVVLKCIKELSEGRPLHTIYVNKGSTDNNVVKFWEKIAAETDGTLHMMTSIEGDLVNQCQLYPAKSSADRRKKYENVTSREASLSTSSDDSLKSDEDFSCLKRKNKVENKVKNYDFDSKTRRRYKEKILQKESPRRIQIFSDSEKSEDVGRSRDLIYYEDDVRNEKIEEGDYVLVNISDSKKFLPGKVIKKDYEFDPTTDSFEFTKALTVKLYNDRNVAVPLESAVRISPDVYEKVIKNNRQSQIQEIQREDRSNHKNNHLTTEYNNTKSRRQSPVKDFEEISYNHNHAKSGRNRTKSCQSRPAKDSKEVYSNHNNRVNIGYHRTKSCQSPVKDFKEMNANRNQHMKVGYHRTKSLDERFHFDQQTYDLPQLYDDEIIQATEVKKKDYLKERIEQQLAESADFLQRLGLNDYTDALQQYTTDDDYTTERRDKYNDDENFRMSQSLNIAPRKSFNDLTSENAALQLMSSYPLIREPSPPKYKSWDSRTKKKGDTKEKTPRKTRRRYRSASVGSNAVERSRKHWQGRPIGKEIAPKRPINERQRAVVACKSVPPLAEEYQTADGIPFPTKTDRKLYRQPRDNNGTWLPGNNLNDVPYQHRDIIGHRVVEFPGANPGNNTRDVLKEYNKREEIREKKKMDALQNNRVIRERRDQEKKRAWEKQVKARDEQARQQQMEREEQGYTKVQITIEKDRSILDNKQRQHETHRMFERERERRNQQKKHARIDAMKERKQNYPQLEGEKNDRPKLRQSHSREEKRTAVEQNRIEKEIQSQEGKLNRLKQLRKKTDARFDAMRRNNDQHRDINEHVKGLNQGRVRSEILP